MLQYIIIIKLAPYAVAPFRVVTIPLVVVIVKLLLHTIVMYRVVKVTLVKAVQRLVVFDLNMGNWHKWRCSRAF